MSKSIYGTITCNIETTKHMSCGIIDGVNISIKPSYSCTWSATSFNFCPELLIEVSEIRNEKHLLLMYDAIRKFIKYAFMRMNLEPDSFVIRIGEKITGEICTINTTKDDNEKEDCNFFYGFYTVANSLYYA